MIRMHALTQPADKFLPVVPGKIFRAGHVSIREDRYR